MAEGAEEGAKQRHGGGEEIGCGRVVSGGGGAREKVRGSGG